MSVFKVQMAVTFLDSRPSLLYCYHSNNKKWKMYKQCVPLFICC